MSTVLNREQFDIELEKIFEICLTYDHPLRISGSYSTEDGYVILMYGYFDTWPHEELKSLRTEFSIRNNIFRIADKFKERMLDMGKLVYDDILDDNADDRIKILPAGDHNIVIPWGRYPVNYRFRGTEEEAILECLRYGGTLRLA